MAASEFPDGARIRELREAEGLSMDDMARESGLNKTTIHNAEVQPVKLYRKTLKRIADSLGVDLEEVISSTVANGKKGDQHPLSHALYEFDAFIEERTRDFVGRDFVFSRFQDFQNQRDIDSGYFVLEGDPGQGKSAILCEYVNRNNTVAHFNSSLQGCVRTDQFLQSVCAQMAARYSLPYKEIPNESLSDGRLLNRILKEASERTSPDENVVIVVDALDEVEDTKPQSSTNILLLPDSLPARVFFLLSTRRLDDSDLVCLAAREPLDLRTFSKESREDICLYIRSFAQRKKMAAWLKRNGFCIDAFVEQLADQSQNNFMYLRHVLPELESGSYTEIAIADIPSGLSAYYKSHWRRMGMNRTPRPDRKLKVIYILSMINEPISRKLLSEYAGENELEVQNILDEWAAFLSTRSIDGTPRYSIYHNSFRKFLREDETVEAAGVSLDGLASTVIDELLK